MSEDILWVWWLGVVQVSSAGCAQLKRSKAVEKQEETSLGGLPVCSGQPADISCFSVQLLEFLVLKDVSKCVLNFRDKVRGWMHHETLAKFMLEQDLNPQERREEPSPLWFDRNPSTSIAGIFSCGWFWLLAGSYWRWSNYVFSKDKYWVSGHIYMGWSCAVARPTKWESWPCSI